MGVGGTSPSWDAFGKGMRVGVGGRWRSSFDPGDKSRPLVDGGDEGSTSRIGIWDQGLYSSS